MMRNEKGGMRQSTPHSSCSFLIVFCEQGEIRTHDTGLPYTGFRDRRLQPLGHLSRVTKYHGALGESQRESTGTADGGLRIGSRRSPPSIIASSSLEERLQFRPTLLRQNPCEHFGAVIQARVPNDVANRARHPRLLIPRTEDEHAHPSEDDCARAH